MNKEQALNFLKEHLKEMNYLNSTLSIVSWDMEVMAPVNAIDYRSEVMGYLSTKYHQLATDSRIEEALDVLNSEENNLAAYEVKLVENFKDAYEKNKNIPESLQRELTIATSKASQYWKQAKEQQNYDIFKPYLKKIIELTIQQAECVGYKHHIYDAFLDDFEKGMTVEELDRIFPPLRDGLVELLNKIKCAKVKEPVHPTGEFDKIRQKQLTLFLLDAMGYDFKQSGRVDETEHPFTASLGPKDVRITTHYYKEAIESALFSTMHEGGHAIYDQNMPHHLADYGIDEAPSMGIHESQSRFYENIIGRSLPFWHAFYPKLQQVFPEYQTLSLEDFYHMINKVTPSYIRIEADEVTYSLHVIIRYEIEKLMVSGGVTVDELPKLWNQKYEEYLGVTPENDSQGIMQDMHWSDAMIGYFPSYALGNLYGAQFYYQMKKDIPNLNQQIEAGNLTEIFNWLKVNIHEQGNLYTPAQLVERVTGEPLNPQYFLDYLYEKYSSIYHF